MRILTLSNTPLDERTGSGYVVLGYAERLRALGHEVDLLGPADYEPLHGLRRGIRYRQAIGMATACRRRLARGHYDVVELWGGEAWLAVELLARRRRRRFLIACHSNGLEPHCAAVQAAAAAAGAAAPPQRWYQLDHSPLADRAFRRADALVTVSPWDRDDALRRGYRPPARVLAIENPLPDAYLGRPFAADREPLIGFCGSWIPRKGVELLTRDLPPLLRELPSWRLALAGVGHGFRAADHFPADVLPRIEVVPHADRDAELPALYRRLAIVIAPSLYESFGLAAAEAMACGAALVATRVGFAAGLADGEEALLLEAPAPGRLAAAVRRLIADPALRERVARGGWRRVQSLRWDRAGERLAAAYESWLAELRDGAGGSR